MVYVKTAWFIFFYLFILRIQVWEHVSSWEELQHFGGRIKYTDVIKIWRSSTGTTLLSPVYASMTVFLFSSQWCLFDALCLKSGMQIFLHGHREKKKKERGDQLLLQNVLKCTHAPDYICQCHPLPDHPVRWSYKLNRNIDAMKCNIFWCSFVLFFFSFCWFAESIYGITFTHS